MEVTMKTVFKIIPKWDDDPQMEYLEGWLKKHHGFITKDFDGNRQKFGTSVYEVQVSGTSNSEFPDQVRKELKEFGFEIVSEEEI